MADETGNDQPYQQSGSGMAPEAPTSDAIKAQASLKARKRTKTGCLTCRRRRIKCGEERPTCANCIKSKRGCEGYAPRLTFKDPLGSFHPAWPGRTFPYQSIPSHNGATGQYLRPNTGSGSQPQFPVIAPRPLPGSTSPDQYSQAENHTPIWHGGAYPGAPDGYSTFLQQNPAIPSTMAQMYHQQSALMLQGSQGPQGFQSLDPGTMGTNVQSYGTDLVQLSPDEIIANNANQSGSASQWLQNSVANELANNQALANAQAPASADFQHLNSPLATNYSDQYAQGTHEHTYHNHTNGNIPPNATLTESIPATTAPIANGNGHYPAQFGATIANRGDDFESYRSMDQRLHPAPRPVQSNSSAYGIDSKVQAQATMIPMQEPDDDYYDVESDEENILEQGVPYDPHNNLGLMVALSASQGDHAMRTYHTFLHKPDILTTYVPKYTASPLMDPTTARIFAHFITATAPGLSSFNRHPVDPAIIFSGTPVPKSQQALWTYTLPVMALSNQCLLQAMLALAGLQIARLQQAPLTTPMKHYHYALRRVAKDVATPSKRTSIATIAATLILGQFEAMAAEHTKWSSHLAGARQLLMEIDFKGTTKRIKEEKTQKLNNTNDMWYSSYVNAQFQPFDDGMPFVPDTDGIDETLVGQLMGWKIKYDQYGSVTEEVPTESRQNLSEKEIEDYQIYRDLFWFYCKLDVIQSVIRGTELLLPYDRWVHCPPRAPIGRLDAVYGTMDHMHLLLGRVADFASKDISRKLKAMRANGGQWRPPPGMFLGGPPTGPPPPDPSFASPTGPPPSAGMAQPTFFGMMPDSGPIRMPDAFSQAPRHNLYIPTSPDEDFELAAATATAEMEWNDIQIALSTFERSLGPAWAPLSADAAPMISTTFGPALQYRTYQIALIWSMFETARIIAARTHPSMPPASMMAAGISARQTAQWANTIGRIVIGLQPPPEDQPLNPTLGATLTETLLPLFFAGVQYGVAAQRAEVVDRLMLIARRTGQESASLIAAGLETCWVKSGEAGRAPPYTKTVRTTTEEYGVATTVQPDDGSGDGGSGGGGGARGGKKESLVYLQPGKRQDWGMGIMSLEEDFREMSIVKRDM